MEAVNSKMRTGPACTMHTSVFFRRLVCPPSAILLGRVQIRKYCSTQHPNLESLKTRNHNSILLILIIISESKEAAGILNPQP